MTYPIDDDIPLPPPAKRGRKPGSRNRNSAKSDAAIIKGADLVKEGSSPSKAAIQVHAEYYGKTAEAGEGDRRTNQLTYLANLIRQRLRPG